LPGINDNDSNFTALARLAKGLNRVTGVEILPYHTMGEGKYRSVGKEYAFAGVKPPSAGQVAYYQKMVDELLK
jgi:pyruvate formate lyase activating enzyme